VSRFKQRNGITISILPDEEWRFDGITDDELTDCYWWEYCRESAAVKLASLGMAKSGSDFKKACESQAASILTTSVLSMLQFLGSEECGSVFPRLGWEAAKNLKFNNQGVTVGKFWSEVLDENAAHATWVSRGSQIRVAPKNVSVDAAGLHTVKLPLLGGSIGTRGATRASFLVTVDWRFSPEQVAQSFSSAVEEKRPVTEAQARAITASPAGIPQVVNPRKALGWLSILRRKRTCTWARFVDAYSQDWEAIESKPMPEIRELKARCRKAEEVLAQFEEKPGVG
jgi:hypothetical protein